MKYPVLMKVDDFSSTSKLSIWEALYALCNKHAVHIDIGVIAREADSSILKNFVTAHQSEYIHYFRHGHLHIKHEFTSKKIFISSLSACETFENNVFGRELMRFGAPFNILSSDFIDFYYEKYPFGVMYYPDYNHTDNALDRSYTSKYRYISFKYHVSLERKDKGYDPDFDYFTKAYAKVLQKQRPLVIQIHPDRWSEQSFVEIENIFLFLKEKSYQFISPDEFLKFIEQNRWMDSIDDKYSALDEILAGGVEWHASKYTMQSLDVTNRKLRNILSLCHLQHEKNIIYDIGCGVGDWFFLLHHIYPESYKIGFEVNARIAQDCEKILNMLNIGNTYIIQQSPVGQKNLSYEKATLTISNRSLNYMDIIGYVNFIYEFSQDNSCHYIGIHNVNFYLCGLKQALMAKNLKLAAARCKVLLSSIQYFCGVKNRITTEMFHLSSDIEACLRMYGFKLLNKFIDDNDTITNFIFIKNDFGGNLLDNNIKICSIGMRNDIVCNSHANMENRHKFEIDDAVYDDIFNLIAGRRFDLILGAYDLNSLCANHFCHTIIKIICLFYIEKYAECICEIENFYKKFSADVYMNQLPPPQAVVADFA